MTMLAVMLPAVDAGEIGFLVLLAALGGVLALILFPRGGGDGR